jgi:hypothetical protein
MIDTWSRVGDSGHKRAGTHSVMRNTLAALLAVLRLRQHTGVNACERKVGGCTQADYLDSGDASILLIDPPQSLH